MPNFSLEELRAKINEIDAELLRLLNERAAQVLKVAEVKEREAQDNDPQYYRPNREIQVLKRLLSQNDGLLSDEQVTRIFREIVSSSLALEQGFVIAYLGPPGTYTQSAVTKHFGNSVQTSPQRTIPDVFDAIASDEVHYGVVPIENSTEGTVNQSLDSFLKSDIRICGEVSIPIHHMFMAQDGVRDEDVQVIYSHQQSFAQCREWITRHFAQVEQHVVSSNAEGAKQAKQVTNAAAIASEMSATQYSLSVLHRRIEDQKDNTTRFLVLGKQKVGVSGHDKTSILVQTANKAGALVEVLSPFKDRNISLSQVVPRPALSGHWSYVFFIDLEGHVEDDNVRTALDEVAERSMEIKVLGSYPKALD